jgi:hypothetical protein
LVGVGGDVSFGLLVTGGVPVVALPAAVGLFDEPHAATRLNATTRRTRVDR